eukprot:3990845-Pyramimonas_sp.AAC.1
MSHPASALPEQSEHDILIPFVSLPRFSEERLYNNTLGAAQNTLDAPTDTCLRTACAGADPMKHLCREGNSFADELTWACRACPHTSKRSEYLAPLYTSKVLGLMGLLRR